jgi:hypothetical protein
MLRPLKLGGTLLRMNYRRKKVSMKEQLEEALDEIGGEPLDGSGFENEKPDEGFTGAVHLPSIFLPASPKGSQ